MGHESSHSPMTILIAPFALGKIYLSPRNELATAVSQNALFQKIACNNMKTGFEQTETRTQDKVWQEFRYATSSSRCQLACSDALFQHFSLFVETRALAFTQCFHQLTIQTIHLGKRTANRFPESCKVMAQKSNPDLLRKVTGGLRNHSGEEIQHSLREEGPHD